MLTHEGFELLVRRREVEHARARDPKLCDARLILLEICAVLNRLWTMPDFQKSIIDLNISISSLRENKYLFSGVDPRLRNFCKRGSPFPNPVRDRRADTLVGAPHHIFWNYLLVSDPAEDVCCESNSSYLQPTPADATREALVPWG